MMQEQWIAWDLLSNSQKKYELDSLVYEGLARVSLSLYGLLDPNQRCNITFVSTALANRSYSGDLMDFKLQALEKKYGKDFYQLNSFFKVMDSEYSRWLFKVWDRMYRLEDIYHYAFITSDKIIDIVLVEEIRIAIDCFSLEEKLPN